MADFFLPLVELGSYAPSADEMIFAGRALRTAGAILLHVGGILILLF